MYCIDCGKKLSDKAKICPSCGCPTRQINKSNLTAFLLCLFIGTLGAHRFYVGKKGSAIAMLLLTFSFFGFIISAIWSFVDFVIISCGCFEDKNGFRLSW